MFGEIYREKPAKHRWGTMAAGCAANCMGRLFYGLSKRVFVRAFPDAVAPPVFQHDDSDFHKVLRSKIHRTLQCLGDATKDINHCCVAFISTPLDHLNRVLQQKNLAGLLSLLQESTNPFAQCQLDLAEIVDRLMRL